MKKNMNIIYLAIASVIIGTSFVKASATNSETGSETGSERGGDSENDKKSNGVQLIFPVFIMIHPDLALELTNQNTANRYWNILRENRENIKTITVENAKKYWNEAQ